MLNIAKNWYGAEQPLYKIHCALENLPFEFTDVLNRFPTHLRIVL